MFNPLAHPICFSQPLWPAGPLTHVPLAMFLVDVVRPRVIVKLGAREGAIFSAYAQAIKELELKSVCYGVDDWSEPIPNLILSGYESDTLQSHHAVFYGDVSRLIDGPPENVIESFENGSIDLLHVSSAQDYESAKEIIQQWRPKMSARGAIVLEGTNDRHDGHSVWKLWEEISARLPHFQFAGEGGLGVFAAAEEPPAEIKQLFPEDPREIALRRQFFLHHGRRLKLQSEKEQLIRQLKERAAEIHLRELQIEETRREVEHVAMRLESSQKHEGVLLWEIAGNRQRIEALTTELATTEERLQAILNSRAWRWVTRYGNAKNRYVAPISQRFRPLPVSEPPKVFEVPAPIDPHEAWLEVNQWNPRRAAVFGNQAIAQWQSKPPADASAISSTRTVAPPSLKPIRALMCAFNLNLEGAPQSQYEMTVRLKEKGVIDPIVFSPTDGPLRQFYERHDIPVRVRKHPLLGVEDSGEYEKRIKIFVGWLHEWKVELVYGNTLQTFYAIDAAHEINLPSIWNPRESEPWATYFDFLPVEVAHRALRCFAYPYQVVFVAQATMQAWNVLNSRHNFMFIHNGLNRERFDEALSAWTREAARERLGIEPDELIILSLGTVCDRKNQIDLVRAVRYLTEEDAARIKIMIVGDRDNEYSQKLKRAVKDLSGSRRARIQILPESDDVALFYRAADAFVCTSRLESFPRVILEALAAGLPIITTPVFGISEQVKHEESALFYEPGDLIALADNLTRIIVEPDLRAWLSQNTGPALDALIDFETMVSSYADVFREAWLSGASRNRNTDQAAGAA
jgi:glycosyltransferase involved in cell wall biosynthesis